MESHFEARRTKKLKHWDKRFQQLNFLEVIKYKANYQKVDILLHFYDKKLDAFVLLCIRQYFL